MSSEMRNKTLAPKLRFPAFSKNGEWRLLTLKEILNYERPDNYIVKDTNYSKEGIPVLTANKSFILGYTREDFGVFDNPPVIIFDDFTTDKKYVDFPFKVKSSAIKILKVKGKDDIKFIYELMTQIRFEAKEHKRYYISSYQNISIPVPHPEEQQKIADCLYFVDALITAGNEKLEMLKAHKKGLIQQLFPAEGETVPKLRFPEFQNEDSWIDFPLGRKVEMISGFPFKSSEISEDVNGIPLMRGINITEGFIRHRKEIDRFYHGETIHLNKYKLKIDDLVIGMDGSKVGKNSALITNIDVGSLLVQRVARLRTKQKATIQFISQQINSIRFHNYVDRINTSSGIPHISLKQIQDFMISFPPSYDEQKTIADCLCSLDTLVTSQENKIEALRDHKKGLMQQLFPTQNDVSNE